jgi:hypothetical protein
LWCLHHINCGARAMGCDRSPANTEGVDPKRISSAKGTGIMNTKNSRRAKWLAIPAAVAAVAVAAPAAASASEPESEPTTIVVTKEWRHLQGWASEKVPAYQCPATNPYLIDKNFAPGGTTLINGVEIDQSGKDPWPIGVSITIWSHEIDGNTGRVYSTGISGAPLASSATNWDPLHIRAYRVKLHCTSNKAEAFSSTSTP